MYTGNAYLEWKILQILQNPEKSKEEFTLLSYPYMSPFCVLGYMIINFLYEATFLGLFLFLRHTDSAEELLWAPCLQVAPKSDLELCGDKDWT